MFQTIQGYDILPHDGAQGSPSSEVNNNNRNQKKMYYLTLVFPGMPNLKKKCQVFFMATLKFPG